MTVDKKTGIDPVVGISTELFLREVVGVKPLVLTTEMIMVRDGLKDTAQGVANNWGENGLISNQTKLDLLSAWNDLIFVNTEGVKSIINWECTPYRLMLELASNMDLKANPEMGMLVKESEDGIKKLQTQFDLSLMYGLLAQYRPNLGLLGYLREGTTTKPGILILNWDLGESHINPIDYKHIALEESSHMVSQLLKYGIGVKWIEETAARLIAFTDPGGHDRNKPNEFGYAGEMTRWNEYRQMLELLRDRFGLDLGTFVNMFWGKEPVGSKQSESVKELLLDKGIEVLGEYIDFGRSFADIMAEFQS